MAHVARSEAMLGAARRASKGVKGKRDNTDDDTEEVVQSLLASDEGLAGIPPDSKDAVVAAFQQYSN